MKKLITVILATAMLATTAHAEVRPEVIARFQADGGTVNEVTETVLGADYDGAYIYGTKCIEVRQGASETVRAHEFGHYVYRSTRNQWDEVHGAKMAELFCYYKGIDRRCYTENECFAVLYSVYCTEATGGDLRELMEYAEQVLLKGE